MNYGSRARLDRPLVTFTRVDEIVQKPTDWLVEDWLVSDSLAGLIGPSGSYKSFLAIDWACSVATGLKWLGRPVKGGQVYYLAGEGLSGLRRRISAWEVDSARPLKSAPLFIGDGLPPLCEELSISSLMEEMKWKAEEAFFTTGADPVLIIIDTVARAMAGKDENSASDMGKLVQAMDWLRSQWGATVLSVHHTGNGKDRQGRARGSSAYLAALDSACVVTPGGKGILLRVTKAKDWAAPAPLQLTPLEVEVNDETSLVLHESGDSEAARIAKEKVLELRAEGKSIREIACELGISKSSVQRMSVA